MKVSFFVAGFLGALSLCAPATDAQEWLVTVPTFVMQSAGTSTRPITAAEAAANSSASVARLYTGLSFRSDQFPIDSLRRSAAATGAQWLARVQAQPIRGLQLNPSGRIGVVADQDAYARAQIAARLATPGLSLSDKAYALLTGVEAFADQYAPARLRIAEAYLQQLDALGVGAAAWQFEARKALLWTYYLLGRSPDVIRLGTRAVELVGIMPFANRNLMFGQISEQVYSPTIEALTGQPDARSKIDQLNATLQAAAVLPPATLAIDSDYVLLASVAQQAAQNFIQGNSKLGTRAAPLIAQYWLNRASHDSATVALDDGTIHLVEIAHTGCAPCVYELYALERMHRQFPAIAPALLTWTFGYWGNRLVEKEEEVQHLTEYFVANTKITFPVGIWAGPKVPNADGGVTPMESPNLKDYPLLGKPMLWVVDGKGVIRRVFTGYDREIETQIVRTVEFLLREAKQ